MRLISATALFAFANFSGAYAQSQSPVGQWACQFSYTELDRTGNRTSGHMQEYVLAVYPNGTLEVAGNILGGVGATPFQGQGQWNMQGELFNGQAPVQQQDMFGSIPIPFMILANVAPDGRSMSLTNEQADPSRTYVMSRSITICDRRG
jgi:hypothetical protein